MTVPIQDPIVSYTANGTATLFSFPFRIVDASDLQVLVGGQILNSGFLINGIGDDSGSVDFDTAPLQGANVLLVRSVAKERLFDYQDNGDLLAPTVNNDFDRIWMSLQDVGFSATRAIQYPLSELTNNGLLPVAAQRQKTILAFDDNGAQTLLPIGASVGAGDLKNEVWKDGVDFTAGTSSTLTLSRAYTSKANLGSVVMSGVVQDPDTYRLDSPTVLRFLDDTGTPTPIPLGVSKVWCYGGTTLSLNTPATASVTDDKVASGSSLLRRIFDQVSVRDPEFGAIGTGLVDDSGAFQAVENSVPSGKVITCLVPDGTYRLDTDVVAGAGIVHWYFAGGAKLSGTGKLSHQKSPMTYNGSPNYGARSSVWHGTDANPATDGTVPTMLVQRVDKSSTSDDSSHLISALYVTHKRLTGGTGWLYGTYSYLEDQSNSTHAQSAAVAGAYHGTVSGAGWGVYGEANSHSQFTTITAGEFDAINLSGADYPYYEANPTQPPPNNNFSCGIWTFSVGKRNSFGIGIGAQNTSQTTTESWQTGIYMQTWSAIKYAIDIQAQPSTLINFKYGASTDGTGLTVGGIGLDCGASAAYGTGADQGAIHLRQHRFCFGSGGYMVINGSLLEFWYGGSRRGYIDLSGADHAL